MTTRQLEWEHVLLTWATQRFEDAEAHTSLHGREWMLDSAYRKCASITAANSRTFHLAASLLGPEKQRVVHALYAFCRRTDDLVDRPGKDPRGDLEEWLQTAMSRDVPDDPVLLAFADTRLRYRIPSAYVEQLVRGVGRDLGRVRYETFDELSQYAYGVASTVGLMVMHVVGFTGAEAIPHAVKLGVALQLTNILRDVGADWADGRLYLPQDELSIFGLGESDIADGRITGRWRAFMAYQVERNRRLYTEAWPGISMLGKDGQLAIAAAARLYQGILDDIQAHDGNVFTCRAHLGTAAKLSRLPRIWLDVRMLDRDRSSDANGR